MPDSDATPATAPFSMGRVALTVHDLDRVSAFYQQVVGLHRLRSDADTVELGAGGATLLELRRGQAAKPRSPQDAGLFHTAFLLPERADLGRWLKRAVDQATPIAGASDHRVSEALYLSDPEGNGVEIYADRPRSAWVWRDGLVVMGTEALDVADLVASGGGQHWRGAPDHTTVGHVHLQVGDLPAAEAFYAGVLGAPLTARYPGGSFFGAGGYHHHLAANVWNSRGAPVRPDPALGLADVEIRTDRATLDAVAARAPGAVAVQGDPLSLRDPWGTSVTVVAG